MLTKLVVVAALARVGFVVVSQLGGQSAADACIARAAAFQKAYTEDLPQSESGPSDLRGKAALAEIWCREGKFDDAHRVISTSMKICRLNNGCREKSS